MTAEPALPAVTAVRRLRLRPGDTLVVRLASADVSTAAAAAVASRARDIAGRPGARVLVLTAGCEVEVIPGERC